MKRLAALAACLLLLAGCDEDTRARVQMQENQQTAADAGRFSVVKVSSFRDLSAYNNERGIYILTDKQTGKEFVGVSGIGISELGSHASGKSRVGDER